MTEQMTPEQAQAIVAEYQQIEREVAEIVQPLIVAAFQKMTTSEVRGPSSPAATEYRALTLGLGALVQERAAHLLHKWNGERFYNPYAVAQAVISASERQQALADKADTLDLVERIAYGER